MICAQERQHDEKHKVFGWQGHSNDNPFDHPHNQERYILQNEKKIYYVLCANEEQKAFKEELSGSQPYNFWKGHTLDVTKYGIMLIAWTTIRTASPQNSLGIEANNRREQANNRREQTISTI